jgi:putative salt-induced outer membrane protein
MKLKLLVASAMLSAFTLPALSQDQTSQTPPKVYTGNIGAGLSLTGGNTKTANFNLTGELVRDPKKRNVLKLNGLYLRANADNKTVSDRLLLGLRDDYAFSKNTFLYGAFSYLRDPFKDISYLVNPQGGIGHRLIATDQTTLSLTGGGGVVWEKNPGFGVATSGTLNAGENFSIKLSDRASLTQVVAALWKTSDFNDALYHFGIALTASVVRRAELKVEFLDDFKNVTPAPAIKKNDTAFITSLLYKF